MPMRMSGLISGLDTDSLISQLVSGKRLKVTKSKGNQTKLSWKQDKWKDLNKQLVSLRTMASNMRWSTAWNKKATTVSDTSKASVITGSGAVDSVQSLKITQLAKSCYLTGGKVEAVDSEGKATGEKLTALSKMSDLGFTGDTKLNITTNGKTSELSINGDSTISDVLSALKKQGLNASFDENNQRFFISSKTTGAKSDFSITASDATGQTALDKMGISTYDATTKKNLESYLTYTESDVESEVLRRASESAESYKDLFNSMKNAEKTVDDLVEQRAKMDEAGNPATDEDKAAMDQKIADARANADELSGKVADAWSAADWEADFEYNDDGTIKSMSNVRVRDDESGEALRDQVRAEFDQRAEYAQTQIDAITKGTLKGKATKVTGQDAKIELNGAEFESATNVFEINGLTITALSETKDNEEITLTTTNDTSGIYDQIKNFVSSYNKIINELDKLYNADSSSKFTPLTDEEKEALSDSEVEKYETKIKDGLFKGDETVSAIMSSLTQSMAQGITINGKSLHLSDFGINTLSYFEAEKNETHAFHIDGDSDDEKTSGKADRLKSLIASDPDSVSSFFTKLSNDIYSRLDKLSSRQAGRRTYGSFYEDQTMKSDYTGYDSKIKELEDAANEYEDRLYSKFSKMEAAMAKLQSKTSALSGLFGGAQ
ncbi:MAG: flagellar filament capping protein FliD [Lachnospiraceae bacterium]|nr:flagellar filament capping protein FliD [Lachnospiraceae bacterium]